VDRPEALPCALFLTMAFALAGLPHAFWLRSPWSAPFNVPLDGYRTFRGQRLFGDNKTWRGLLVLVPAVGAAFSMLGWLRSELPPELARGLWSLSPAGYALLGTWAGFGFMAGELPNSFLKRQLGIPPGAPPAGRLVRPLAFLVDRLDSITGALLALALVVPTPLATWLLVLVIGPALHWAFSVLLFHLGVKARPA
jgi:CDP-archaeol synthase